MTPMSALPPSVFAPSFTVTTLLNTCGPFVWVTFARICAAPVFVLTYKPPAVINSPFTNSSQPPPSVTPAPIGTSRNSVTKAVLESENVASAAKASVPLTETSGAGAGVIASAVTDSTVAGNASPSWITRIAGRLTKPNSFIVVTDNTLSASCRNGTSIENAVAPSSNCWNTGINPPPAVTNDPATAAPVTVNVFPLINRGRASTEGAGGGTATMDKPPPTSPAT